MVLAGAFVATGLTLSSPATSSQAATTPTQPAGVTVNTTDAATKTAYDAKTGAPIADGSTVQAGQQIKYVISDQRAAQQNLSTQRTLTDTMSTNQTYDAGSLTGGDPAQTGVTVSQTPDFTGANPIATFTPTYQQATENTGTAPTAQPVFGQNQEYVEAAAAAVTPTPVTKSGDGFNPTYVRNAKGELLVWSVTHHSYHDGSDTTPSTWGIAIPCETVSGRQVCTSYGSTGLTSQNPANFFDNNLYTTIEDVPTVTVGSKGYFALSDSPAAGGNSLYIGCADFTNATAGVPPVPCGQPVKIATNVKSANDANFWNSGVFESGGKLYVVTTQNAGPADQLVLACYDPATGAVCAGFDNGAGTLGNVVPALTTTSIAPGMQIYSEVWLPGGKLVFTLEAGGTYCVQVSGTTLVNCDGTSPIKKLDSNNAVLPVINGAGNGTVPADGEPISRVTGFCSGMVSNNANQCYDLNGKASALYTGLTMPTVGGFDLRNHGNAFAYVDGAPIMLYGLRYGSPGSPSGAGGCYNFSTGPATAGPCPVSPIPAGAQTNWNGSTWWDIQTINGKQVNGEVYGAQMVPNTPNCMVTFGDGATFLYYKVDPATGIVTPDTTGSCSPVQVNFIDQNKRYCSPQANSGMQQWDNLAIQSVTTGTTNQVNQSTSITLTYYAYDPATGVKGAQLGTQTLAAGQSTWNVPRPSFLDYAKTPNFTVVATSPDAGTTLQFNQAYTAGSQPSVCYTATVVTPPCDTAAQTLTNTAQWSGDATPVKSSISLNLAAAAACTAPAFSVSKATTDQALTLSGQDQDVTRTYQVTVTNTGTGAGPAPAVTDTPSAPNGFAVTGVTVDGTAATLSNGSFTIPAGTTDLPVGGTVTYTVVVTYHVTFASIQSTQWADLAGCQTANGNATTDNTKGLFNSVAFPAGTNDTDGAANNVVCTNVNPPTPAPSIKIVKKIDKDDANSAPGHAVAAGEQMAVTFDVTNTGNVPLSAVNVTDDVIAASAIDCGGGSNVIGDLAVGATKQCTATYPAPAVGTQHTDTGKATGTPPTNPDGSTPPNVTSTDQANAYVPAIQIIKAINGDDANTAPGVSVQAGSTMNVTFLVKNTGLDALTGVTVTDEAIAGTDGAFVPADQIKCSTSGTNVIAKLNAGASDVCFATLPAPAAGVVHGDNATAVGTPVPNPDGTQPPNVTDQNPAYANVAAPAQFAVAKTTSDGPVALTGNAQQNLDRHYTVTVTNTGTQAGNAPDVTDTPSTPAGFRVASVTVDGNPVALNGSSFTIAGGQSLAAGANVQHQVVVTYQVTPSQIDSATWTSLGQCTSANGSATSNPTQGLYNSVAFPNGTVDSDGAANNAACSNVTGTPSVKIIKKINGDDADNAPGVAVVPGSTMNITFDVTNTGNEPLTGVTVTDDKVAAAAINCGNGNNVIGDLAAGATKQCTATLPAPALGTQHTDNGTVTGLPPKNPDGSQPPAVTDHNPANAYVPGTPAITIVKLIDGDDANTTPGHAVAPGEQMQLTFVVNNTGSAPLTNVKVTDDVATNIVCPKADLAPGEKMTCTGSYPAPAVGQQHTDTATVVGTPPATPTNPNPTPVTDTDKANAYVPSVSVVKYINGDDANTAPGVQVAAGSTMNITFKVTNNGLAGLTDVTVTDQALPGGDGTSVPASGISCPSSNTNVIATLAPGASVTCTAQLPAPAAGKVHSDDATVVGTPVKNPDGSQPAKVTDHNPANAYVPGAPAIKIVKSIDGDDANAAPGHAVAPGEQMKLTFDVTNTGSVALTNVTVTDDQATGISCPKTELAPGEKMTCTGSAPAPAVGVQHTDTGTVVGTPPATPTNPNPTPVKDQDKANAYVPSVKIIKAINGDDADTAPGVSVKPGSTMDITFTVTNNGLADLTNVTVTDDKVAATAITCPGGASATPNVVPSLKAGQTVVCTAQLPAPAAGVQHTDTATVVGTPVKNPDGTQPPNVTDKNPANAHADSHPAIKIVKSIDGDDANDAPGHAVAPGEQMKLTFDVTNTGDVTLTDVTVTDDQATGIVCPKTELAPGEKMTCTGTAPAPAVGVQHTDTGTVVGTPPTTPGNPTPPPVTDKDKGNAYVPGIKIIKKINGDDADNAPGVEVPAGSMMDITFEVTNTGLAGLTNVTVTDDKVDAGSIDCGSGNVIATLAPGQSVVCKAQLPAPAAGVQHTDTATVVGTPVKNPDGTQPPTVTDHNPANAYVSTPPPSTPPTVPGNPPVNPGNPGQPPAPTQPTPPLARTGGPALPIGIAGLVALVAGGALVIRRKSESE